MNDQFPGELRLITAIAAGVLTIGTLFYHFVEHLSFLDAAYFSVITLATVGYGDIVPKTPLGKVFTIFYVLIGISIIGAFANAIVKNAAARRMERLKEKEKKEKK